MIGRLPKVIITFKIFKKKKKKKKTVTVTIEPTI